MFRAAAHVPGTLALGQLFCGQGVQDDLRVAAADLGLCGELWSECRAVFAGQHGEACGTFQRPWDSGRG